CRRPSGPPARWNRCAARSLPGATRTSARRKPGTAVRGRSSVSVRGSSPLLGLVRAGGQSILSLVGGLFARSARKERRFPVIAFFRDEEGQGLVEYALIIAVIAIAVIVAMIFLRGQLQNIFSNIGNNLTKYGPLLEMAIGPAKAGPICLLRRTRSSDHRA